MEDVPVRLPKIDPDTSKEPVISTELENEEWDPVIWNILPVYFRFAAPLKSELEPLANISEPERLLLTLIPPEVPDVPTFPDAANRTDSFDVFVAKTPLTQDTGIL